MQGLFKLIMNSLYGCQIGKNIDTTYHSKSEHWMKTEYDEKILDYWKLPHGNKFVKMKKDDRLDDDCDIKIILPAHLGAFIVSDSKRIMNHFIGEINGFYNNNVFYTDMDSLYIERKYSDGLKKAKLVGGGLCQGKNDYGDDKFMFQGLYIATKIKYVLTIDKNGLLQGHETLKDFNESKRVLDRSQ